MAPFRWRGAAPVRQAEGSLSSVAPSWSRTRSRPSSPPRSPPPGSGGGCGDGRRPRDTAPPVATTSAPHPAVAPSAAQFRGGRDGGAVSSPPVRRLLWTSTRSHFVDLTLSPAADGD